MGLGQRDASAQDARERYKEASGKAAEGRYDEALAAIDAGLKVDANHLDLRRLRGEVLLQKRDFEGALEAFERFLESNPRGANRRKARKIIRDLQAVKTTFLEVIVEPGPATIYIDSKLLGVFCKAKPGCKKGMLPGSYELIIESPGFEPTFADVTVQLGKTATVKKRLAEKPSKLTVSVVPAGASLTVDGQSASAGEAIEVTAGEHTIAATLEGFAAVTKKITARRGEPLTIELSLAERIPVKLSPAEATLTLDGKPVKLEDGFLQLAPGGDHTLVARAEGYADATVALSASRTPGQPIEVELEKESVAAEKPATATPPVEVIEVSSRRKVGAAFLLGAATVGLGVGAIFGLNAADRWDESKEFCDENVVCSTQEGVDLVNEARSDARWSNIIFATSAGMAVTAVVLWMTAPSADDYRREAAARRGVSIGSGPGDVGVSLGGSF